ncbi:MAG: CinA family nicotinamide mononucleotide deamidase-related protein [Myxococcota bacterium]|nr:CinA family nicotinamide mononucleotide deamidase-related protein [Myxococcota bacterium]
MQDYAIIITQGDELTTGRILNTNAHWLAGLLTDHGWAVKGIITAPDSHNELSHRFRAEAQSGALIISTGGLGPTTDDHTRNAFSSAFSIPLVQNQLAMAHLKAYCHRRQRNLSTEMTVMSMLPVNAAVIPNAHGSAVGFDIQVNGCRFCALPGVPSEFKSMILDSILPDITQTKAQTLTTFLCFGQPEAVLQERIQALKLSNYRIGYRATRTGNLIKLHGPPLDATIRNQILTALDDCLMAENEDDMAAAIGNQLRNGEETVATAESCTAGGVASWLASIPGASSYLMEGVVTYSNEAKQKYTGLRSETLKQYGAVSRETAEELALGIRAQAQSTWGISVTGIAGPSGGTPQKPVGTVHIAVAGPNDIIAHRQLLLRGTRTEITRSSAAHLLYLLHETRKNSIIQMQNSP